MRKRKRVVVFGIFDGIHDGHRDVFRQAKEHGDELVVIVGRDSSSVRWKGRKPVYSEETRLNRVSKEKHVDQTMLGDEDQSTYGVLQDLQPDVICLGYDQNALNDDLKLWLQVNNKRIAIIRLKPYKETVFHTSFLRKR